MTWSRKSKKAIGIIKKRAMAHNLSGVITSFPYEGPLFNVVLKTGYHFILLDGNGGGGASGTPEPPYGELNMEHSETVRKLSLLGKCGYIETAYFGGIGAQIAEAWLAGKRVEGPLISYDGVAPKTKYKHVTEVEGAINRILKYLGVLRSEEQDEFDVLGLGRYRSNRKIMEASRLGKGK